MTTKPLRRVLAALLALTMVFALAACGGSDSEAEIADDTAASVAEETTAEEETTGGEETTDGEEAASGEATADGALSESPLTAEQEEKKQQLLQVFTMAAQGHGDDGFDYYLVYNDDVSRACLLKADHENQQCIDVTGDVTEDENGWLTIADNTYHYTYSFALSQQDDGTYVITTTNDVTVPLEFVEVDRALTNILAFEGSYTIVNPEE